MDFQAKYAFLTQLIWAINKYIFFSTITLTVFIAFYTVIKEHIIEKTEQNLARIKKKIQVLALGGKEILQKTSPIILLKASSNQIFSIIKEDGNIIPTPLRQQLQESIISPPQLSQIKTIAQKSRNIWKRIETIYILSLIAPETALEILKKTIRHKNANIRYFSLLALGEIKSKKSAQLLLENLNNPNFGAHKIVSLLEKFPDDITEEVIKKMEGADAAVRPWCVKLLSRFTEKQFPEKIKELTHDTSPQVRANACECLGAYNDHSAKDQLLKCLADDAWPVKIQAAKALNKIFGKEYLNEISQLLYTKEWFVKEAVKNIMLKHFQDALPQIEQWMQSDDEAIRRDCVEMLENANYITVIFENLLHNKSASMVAQLRLLKAIVKTKAHLGIESALNTFGKIESDKILEIIGAFDPELKDHIENKLKNLITES